MTISAVGSSEHKVCQSQKDLAKTFRAIFARCVQKIANDYEERKCDAKKNLEALKKGIWYGAEYAEALQSHKQSKRLDYMRNKGHFLVGLFPKPFSQLLKNEQYPENLSCLKKKSCAAVVKPEYKASEALKSFENELAILDCGSTTQLAFYQALLEVWGEEKFNVIFDPSSSTPLTITPQTGTDSPILPFMPLSAEPKKLEGKEWAAGDILYFRNLSTDSPRKSASTPPYHSKHPFGISPGQWVTCLSNQKVTGFGLQSGGYTQEEIKDVLCVEYNKEPDRGFYASEEVRTYFMEGRHLYEKTAQFTISKADFEKQGGGEIVVCLEPNAELIWSVYQAKHDEAQVIVMRNVVLWKLRMKAIERSSLN